MQVNVRNTRKLSRLSGSLFTNILFIMNALIQNDSHKKGKAIFYIDITINITIIQIKSTFL